MKRILPRILPALVISVTMLCALQSTQAQDPVSVDPGHYKVLSETATVRILEFHDTPGHVVPKHSHPNYFVYVFSDAKRLFTTNCSGPGNTVMLKAGDSFSKPKVTHCEKNIGQTNTHVLIVEYKGTSNPPTPRKSPPRE
jgi:beta-alanine degradation protein BauB